MKVRFLMHDVYGQGGGVLTVVRHLSGHLAQRHDVEVVSVLRSREEPVHTFPDAVKVLPLTEPGRKGLGRRRPSKIIPESEPRYARYSAYSDRHLRKYLAGLRGGVVIGMQPGVNVALADLAPDAVGRIAQDHVPFQLRPKELRTAMKRSFPRLDTFLTLTRTDAEHYRKLFGRKVRIRTIPNAAPSYTGPLSSQTERVVVAAGRLEKLKGFDRLIDAWATVHRKHPDWELRIFGSGGQEETLREQISRLGLEGSARLMGYTNNLAGELAASSIFALTSRFEGYPMVLMEAMAAGVPAVSFDCPNGPRDIITHGKDGFLVPDRDVPALADALVDMIELGDRRAELARAARQAAEERNADAVTQLWEDEISWVAGQAARRG